MLIDSGKTLVMDLLLFCPNCGTQHIDKPEPAAPARHYDELPGGMAENQPWDNPPHRTHLCRPADGGCGHRWRPSDWHTNGVHSITSKGVNDSEPVLPLRRADVAKHLDHIATLVDENTVLCDRHSDVLRSAQHRPHQDTTRIETQQERRRMLNAMRREVSKARRELTGADLLDEVPY